MSNEATAQIAHAHELASRLQSLELALSAGGGIGTWDWDVARDRVVANARFAKLYGVDPEKATVGAPVADFFVAMHEDDRERVQLRINEALRTGGEFDEEYRLVQSDGVVVWVQAIGRCVVAVDGTPKHFPGVSFDITARKNAEQKLQLLTVQLERKVIERAQARGRTWQVSPDLLGALNSQGYFETSNPAWGAVLGWSEEEVASMSIFELLHPDDVERTRAGFELTQRGQPAIRFPNRYRCKDGSYRWISWVGVPEDGYVYCSGRDITDEKNAELRLIETQDALRQAQKMEAIGQLTGGIAHDFNNLIGGITGSLDLLKYRISSGRLEGIEKLIERAQNSARRAASLLQRLLAFSRRQALSPQPTYVHQLIVGMKELIENSIGSNIQMNFFIDSDWPTLVDPSQLESSLLNLCINARDAMPDGGSITVRTANRFLDQRSAEARDLPTGDYISLLVADTGTGMSPEVAQQAFEPFFTTKAPGLGTGLGLSMVYAFAKQSNGKVGIASAIGKGTTITLYLPRFTGAVEGDAELPPILP